MCVIIEPVTLIGEGEYNINALTEIKVTDSYLGLDEDVRDCQSKESMTAATENMWTLFWINVDAFLST